MHQRMMGRKEDVLKQGHKDFPYEISKRGAYGDANFIRKFIKPMFTLAEIRGPTNANQIEELSDGLMVTIDSD